MKSAYKKRANIVIGNVYSNLTVVQDLPPVGPRRFWLCNCSCGTTGIRVRQDGLKSGHVKSCGCLRVVAGSENGAATRIHGKTGTPGYIIWVAMWQRCTNPTHKSYEAYKDRAPPECWKDFEVFSHDMGPRPSKGHSIERVDNSKPYGPGNCVWQTAAKQSRNKTNNINITYQGRTLCATDWAEQVSIPVGVICYRFHAGWDAEKILTTKVRTKT